MEQAAAQTWIAVVALLVWPVIALWLYQNRPVAQATLWTILGGYLLLPVNASIKLAQGIPQLDKVSIPALASLVGFVFVARRPIRFWYGFGIAEVLLLMLLLGPLVTSELNNDPVMSGSVLLPGVGIYDGLAAIFAQFVFVLPFFLGRQCLRSATDTEVTLRTLVIAALIYSFPILFEIKMSPQLHNWIYGYYPFQFAQQIRDGGFRPVVFIGHGLGVAFFIMTATLAATALWRTRTRIRKLPPAGVWAYLSLLLVLCKGLASLVYGVIGISLVGLAKPKLQLRLAMAFATFALAYPTLRAADLVPTDAMVSAAAAVNKDRADSLKFRFDHEKILLDKAVERIWFGWGRFGRSRLYNEWGQDISTSDGRWVITIGQFGLFGFAAEFGLLAYTVLRAASALRFAESDRDRIFLAALGLIISITMIDLLPDSALTPLTWLFAGALLGRAEGLQRVSRHLPRTRRSGVAVSQFAESTALSESSIRNQFPIQ